MDNAQGINLSQTFAPFYWGFLVSLFLGGITAVQAYIYFPARQDRSFVRFTAATMLFCDFASSILIAQSVYYYLLPHFGSLVPLSSITPELTTDCLISAIITFIAQIYFVYQLYAVKRLSRTRWLVLGSIAGCAILAFASGIGCVVTMFVFHHGVFSTSRNEVFNTFFGVSKAFGAASDVLATAAMCVYLTSSNTGIKETATLLKRLTRFVIHRGALVTLIQILLLVTFYAAPQRLYWIPFHINVTKLYTSTFFAMLNGRKSLRDNHITLSRMEFCSGHRDLGLEMGLNDAVGDMPMVTQKVGMVDI